MCDKVKESCSGTTGWRVDLRHGDGELGIGTQETVGIQMVKAQVMV